MRTVDHRRRVREVAEKARRYGGWGRNRTGVHGVAVRCITTLPSSLIRTQDLGQTGNLSDPTNLPAAMYNTYIREMYVNNNLAKSGGFTCCGKSVELEKIKTPSYFLSAIEDHIAPWKTTFLGTELMAGANFNAMEFNSIYNESFQTRKGK